MKRGSLLVICITVVGALSMWVTPALAYLGPGAGLSAIGAFLALVLGVIVAFFGFVWYPVKRMLHKGKATGASPGDLPQELPAKSADKGV